MSGADRRSSRSFACPVCSSTEGKCKVLGSGPINCWNVSGPDSHLLGSEWRWLKPIQGMTGSVVIRAADAFLQPKAKGKSPAKAKGKARPTDAPRDPQADRSALDNALARQRERHLLYKRMVDGLKLSETDRQRLAARGLTPEQIDQLEAQGFRSIGPGLYPQAAGCPGFDAQGQYRGKAGFLIPAIGPGADGQPELRGFQVAVCEEQRGEGGAKYTWLSKGQQNEVDGFLRVTEVQADGTATTDESPLFQFSGGAKVERAVLTDGALKAAVVAARQGNAMGFGAPGCNYTSSMGQLLAALRRLQLENSNLRLCVSPDAGDFDNPHILRQLVQVSAALMREGLNVSWLDLQQERGKELGIDVDEADFEATQLVAPGEMLSRVKGSVLEQATRGLTAEDAVGFFPLSEGEETELPAELIEPERYAKGQRLQAVVGALDRGFRHVLLRDPPGAGKSHWAAKLGPEDLKALGVERVQIVSARHFDQAEEFELPRVRGRGHGLKRKADGTIRAMSTHDDAGKGEVVLEQPNCAKLSQLRRYQERNLNGLLGSLCGTCEHRDACESMPGGFRYERAAALMAPVALLHPQSLQSNLLAFEQQEDEDAQALPRTGLILDDVGPSAFIETHSVPLASVELLLRDLGNSSRTVVAVVRQLQALLHEGQGDPSTGTKAKNYGPKQFEAELAAFRAPEAMRRLSWAHLIDVETQAVARHPEQRVCWLEFLALWQKGRAVAWTHDGCLHFSCLNERGRQTLRAAAWVVWADATASPSDLAGLIRTTGQTPDAARAQIVVLREEGMVTGADLRVRQVTGLGSLGYSRSPLQNYLLRVALAALQGSGRLEKARAAVIDTKRGLDLSSDHGAVAMAWMGDSRGSNRAQHLDQLLMIGSPRVNLAAAAARYQLLHNHVVDLEGTKQVSYTVLQTSGTQPMVYRCRGAVDDGFRRYYAGLMAAELEQGLGRLRAFRRPGATLEVWLLGDLAAPFPVELMTLEELLGPEMAEAMGRCTTTHLRAAATELAERGVMPAAKSLAERLDVPAALVAARLEFQRGEPVWLQRARLEANNRREESARQTDKSRFLDIAT